MSKPKSVALVVGLSLAGCKTPAVEPARASPEPGCRVQLTVERESRGGQWFLHAIATNQTAEPLVLTLQDRCPGGAVDFSGLGDGFDYYGTCVMGACTPQPQLEIQLAPGVATRLATAVVDPRGNGCQAALAPGPYELSFALPLTDPVPGVCSNPLVIEREPTAPAPQDQN